VQATAEGAPVARATVEALTTLALRGVHQLAALQLAALGNAGVDPSALLSAPV
jgi:hypothetical protein